MPLVQYIVVRGDLGWPVGALIAQGCHAAIAAISRSYDKPTTQQYLKELDSMHKVILKAESDQQLAELAGKLEQQSLDHYVWIEQPENIRTCLASAPNEKSVLQPHFKPFKLFN